MRSNLAISRRAALAGAAATAAALALPAAGKERKRIKAAAVYTELRHRSHAFNILSNLLSPCLFRGQAVDLGVDVVSLYADQFPADDMSRDVSRRLEIPLHKTIDAALCQGGKELAVDAVLLIGEHGDYPENELGQRMYPRKEFFDQIVAVMKRSRRFAPVFNDKHLSYRWDWAKAMYDEARELGIPLMAGSSVPLAERRPAVEFPGGAEVEQAVSVHGGGMESYGFHALEVLQSFVEARRGGETGVSRVQLVSGDAFRAAAKEGRFSPALLKAALEAEQKADVQRQGRPVRPPAAQKPPPPDELQGDHAILVDYRDGSRGTAVKVDSTSNRWDFACRLKGREQPLVTALCNGPWGNLNLFSALTHAIAEFFHTGRSPYPVERTLLVGGVLDAALRSHHAGGQPIDTPQLEFAYAAQDFSALRETGASWKVVTPATPQPLILERRRV